MAVLELLLDINHSQRGALKRRLGGWSIWTLNIL